MATDADWVEDVRRWYFGGNPPATDTHIDTETNTSGPVELGYEAAQPALQARHWPDPLPPQVKKPG